MNLKMKVVMQMRFLQVPLMKDQVKLVHNYDNKIQTILAKHKNNRINKNQ